MSLLVQNAMSLGPAMKGKLDEYKADRQTLEQQLLKNLRQVRGKYDAEIETMLNSLEYKTRSKVYPKDTKVKVTGFVAKMMEMMFPASEHNWALEPSAIPNIPEDALGEIITGLQQQKYAAFQQSQQSETPLPAPEAVTSLEIEEAVKAFADDRASNMTKEIVDQLSDIGGMRIEYAQLCKRVLKSAGMYGFGVLEGPLVRTQEERSWVASGTGYRAATKKKKRPYMEFVKVWDLFPDLSAKTWYEQEGLFRRRVFLKNGFAELAGRGDFKSGVIKQYIKDHPDGNYVAMNYESELDSINNTSNVKKNRKGRFEVFRWLGFWSAADLEKAGVEGIKPEQKDLDVLADIWFIDDQIIKADLAPFGYSPADSYHVFLYEDDDESGLTGCGLPEVLRDSQMRLCSIDRALMDNMAAAAGPVWEINRALLGRNADVGPMHSFKTIVRDDDNPTTANIPSLRQIPTNAYISEYIALRQEYKNVMDYESNLPAWLMGDARPLGEAFRTSNNMSMMTGGANMITKDVVRSFDRFTVSVISALVTWNMEFNDRPEIKGDYQVIPKGNMSLVAKEVRGAALDQLWATLTPEERAIVDVHKVLIERFKSRDLPSDYILPADKAQEVLEGMRQAAAASKAKEEALTEAKTQKTAADAQRAQAQAQEIMESMQEKIRSVQADVAQKMANAKGVEDRGTLEHVKLLLDGLADSASGVGGGNNGTGSKSGTAADTRTATA